MKRVTLLPKTKRHKQLIKEFGSKWEVIREEDNVICLNNKHGFLISPPDNKEKIRWVDSSEIIKEFKE